MGRNAEEKLARERSKLRLAKWKRKESFEKIGEKGEAMGKR